MEISEKGKKREKEITILVKEQYSVEHGKMMKKFRDN